MTTATLPNPNEVREAEPVRFGQYLNDHWAYCHAATGDTVGMFRFGIARALLELVDDDGDIRPGVPSLLAAEAERLRDVVLDIARQDQVEIDR